MQPRKGEDVFYYQSYASALGGFFAKPFEISIPSQAAAVLPSVGGFASSNTEAFNLHDLVSCSRASAWVAGRRTPGGFSVVTTSVIENLQILEVVSAARIIAQVAVEYTEDGRRLSFAGTRFEGLQLCGRDAGLVLDEALLAPGYEPNLPEARLDWDAIRDVGIKQADTLIQLSDRRGRDDNEWALHRYRWMENGPDEEAKPGVDTYVLCSLVNEVSPEFSGRLSHIVEIPEYGRIFLGEVLISGTSLQLTMIRAELGCTVTGSIHIGTNAGGGHTVPPGASR